MAFSERLAIPASTTEASPASIDIPILPLTVKTVELTFPSGCVGLVGVWLEYQDRQIWPDNPGARFRGNDQAIKFAPSIELEEPPFIITFRGINDDDTFAHTVYAVIDVEYPGGFFENILSRLLPGSGAVALPGR